MALGTAQPHILAYNRDLSFLPQPPDPGREVLWVALGLPGCLSSR